jgi:tRNA modification GTPase
MGASTDTIAAVATPPGRGGVGIVRVSGPLTRRVAEALLGVVPEPRRALFRHFRDSEGEAIDSGLALFFPGPHSFTGEDVLELQGHGGPVILDLLLERVTSLGVRLARPGEFTERAFLNDKLDLAQAEAVADLIDSGSRQAARAAMRSLDGEFSRRIHALVDELIALRTYVEAALDFPDEEIDFLADQAVVERLRGLLEDITHVRASANQGRLLHEGMTVVLAGRPNVGKSSLLNALAGRDSAIVTNIPGTTRDLLREYIQIDGMPLHVIDTAGLREGGDEVEQEGMRRTWAAVEKADRILLLVDDREGFGSGEQAIVERLPAGVPLTVVRNKIDLTGASPGIQSGEHGEEIRLSARDGLGLEVLHGHLKSVMGFQDASAGGFSARRRHLDALERAAASMERGLDRLTVDHAGELLAEELRQAQESLAEITGEFSADDLLGRIFSSFCIGK